MRINVTLSKKSIQDAIRQLKEVQKKIRTELPKVYLQKCVAKIIELANQNLSIVDIGSETKALIQSSWEVSEVIGNRIVLSNTAEFESGKNVAVFVEFGVGIVGQSSNHILADSANYEYNVISDEKDQFGNWHYVAKDGDGRMNIESNYYESKPTKNGLRIKTQGTPATMFLYKAWKKFETDGLYKTLWEQAKAEVIG